MKTRLAGVRPGLMSLFSWGSMPGSPEEVRGFLQRRIMVYLGFVAAFWAVAWLITTLLTLVTRPAEVLTGMGALRVSLHFGSVVVMALLWRAARRKQRSQRWLISVDLIATVLQGCLLAVLIVASKSLIRFRPDVLFILATTYSLIARAAVVPSAAPRTILIGVMTCIPICASVYILYSLAFADGTAVHHYYPGDDSSPALFTAWSIVFCSLSITLSAFVSFVIFGLQRQVQHARQLGQYTLETKIGEGGMGIVYRGRHALLRRPTAIKLLPPERAGDATVARFEREVQITSQLTHPNTVAIYDYGRTPERVLLCDGVSGGHRSGSAGAALRAAAAPARAPFFASDRGRLGRSARRRHHPSRRQTVQRVRLRARPDPGLRQGAGFRSCARPRQRQCRRDARRSDHRHAAVHEPGADHGIGDR
jgi:eukaryotic-like serine/threonine-protein kinase